MGATSWSSSAGFSSCALDVAVGAAEVCAIAQVGPRMIAASASHRMVDKIMYASLTAYTFDASASAFFSPWASSRPIAAVLCGIALASPSLPAQGHADVARHAAGKVDDLESQLIAAWLEVLLPEFIELFGQP